MDDVYKEKRELFLAELEALLEKYNITDTEDADPYDHFNSDIDLISDRRTFLRRLTNEIDWLVVNIRNRKNKNVSLE